VAVAVPGRDRRALTIGVEPALDGALGIDAIEADADRFELSTLCRTTDRLRVQTQQLGKLAGLVVALDHPSS
jgi:hypothetical protein